MKIEYNILWVEDEDSWYNTTKDLFHETLYDLGFQLISKQCKTFDEVKAEITKNNLRDYDLLLVDFTLRGSDSGEKIIEFIRNIKDQPILTDVLFYSSAVENVRQSMHELGLEGVYTADRKDIEPKFEQVVNTTIKKVQDLNNIRGLIMAETSDIDKTMLKIVTTIILKDAYGIGKNLINQIFTNVAAKITDKAKDFEKYNLNGNINRVIKDNVMFDTSEKIKALQFIFDSINHSVTLPYKNDVFISCYSDISKKRNLLGHEIHKPVDGRIIVGSDTFSFEFNDEFCVDMRKKVRKYGEDLDGLFQLITESDLAQIE